MAYTDDAVKAKLSALNETQESIVTVAQWVMFHRRHADRTGTLWLQRLKDSGSNKRLNLIYLANEVAQQSKARRKDDFLVAFAPIIAEATAIAYRGATNEVQAKLKRVVEVWRQRQIFEAPIQEAIETRIDDLDKSRSSSKKPALGGSLFSSSSSSASAPLELQTLVPLQVTLSKAAATAGTAIPTATTEYEKLTDPTKPVPTPPVYAARLSALLKSLASAESAVTESLKARRSLISELETVLETNKAAIAGEETQQATLSTRKTAIEAKKRDVEDGIMRGLSSADTASPLRQQGSPLNDPRMNGRSSATPVQDLDRPDVEELTPPPPETARPLPDPVLDGVVDGAALLAVPADAAAGMRAQTPLEQQDPPIPLQPATPQHLSTTPNPNDAIGANTPQHQQQPQAGADLLSSLNVPAVRQYPGSPPQQQGAAKRRKVGDEEEEGNVVFGGEGDAMADLDEDVAQLLREESRGR